MKRILGLFGGLLLSVLIVVCLYRALTLGNSQLVAAPVTLLQVDATATAERLAAAVRIPTISYEDRKQIESAPLEALHAHLAASFPRLHAAHPPERIGTHSLLYTWTGSDPKLPPIILLAHQDVVPVEPGTEGAWTHPPFAGVIAEGYVWGRGAIDDKASVMAICEAVEALIAQGFQPRRTVYLAFGHDEEIGGAQGAQQIAALLAARGVKAAFTLDEGGAITQGIIAGIAQPVASIMAGEKGYVSLRLAVRGAGGHSSTPPEVSNIGRIASAVSKLEQSPMPARLIPPVVEMLDSLAPQMDFGPRLLIANRWLFEPLLLKALAQGRMTNALIRTTTAPTIFRAGVKDNVLPAEASAVINFRLLPGDTIADVQRHIRDTITDDSITIEPLEEAGHEAPPPSDPKAPAFAGIAQSVREVFPEALVASGVILAMTDNRHYAAVREQAYYFQPFLYTPDDGERIHGTNERIGVQAYARMIQFYAQLLRNAASK